MRFNYRQASFQVTRALSFLLLVTFLVYWPGLEGPFLLDDRVNLQQMGDEGGIDSLGDAVNFVLGNRSGPGGRPVAMASFLLDGQTWPVASRPFKLTNLLLHLLNGVLTAWFSWRVLRAVEVSDPAARLVALLTAAFWLLHPLNVSTTLYVVQRMTQLMMLFSMAGLICYLKGRQILPSQPRQGLLWMSLSLCPLGLLAVLSKENGALLLLAILVLEATLFAGRPRTRLHRAWIGCAVLFPLLIAAGYLAVRFPGLTAGYRFREFSLGERVLTEGRILITYLVNTVVPVVDDFSLHHDDYLVSRSLLQPFTTFTSFLLIAGLVTLAWARRSSQPLFSLAVFWFFGWHLLESTFLPLELYFEHRNYVALVGPLLALAYYLYLAAGRVAADNRLRIAAILGTLLSAVLAVMTLQLSILWGNSLALAAHWAERHPLSYRAQVEYAYLLAGIDETGPAYDRVSALQQQFPDEVALQLLRWNFACNSGLPAPFSVRDIAAAEQSVYYRADLTGEVRTFLDNLMVQRCEYPSRSDIERLMTRLAEIPMRPFERSGFHLLFSDLYVHYRELNPALVQLREAFEIRPDAGFPIRQAILAASAGNYQDSLVFLQRARQADENRGRFEPSRLPEIMDMEQDLKARLGVNQ